MARYQGDSAAMVAARQRFLEAGHYDPLADRLCVRAQPVPDLAVLDAGGGTGFYLDRVRARAPDAAGAWIVTDLSKHAARLGARRYPDLDHVVADTKAALPVSTGGAAVVLDVFAPRNPAEFRRVLAPGGLLLVVVPTDRHLAELRGRPGVLDVQPDKHDRLTGTLAPYFAQAGTELVEAGLRLGGPALADLVGMGPGARHVDDAALRDLRASAPAEVTLSVSLLSFRPAG